MKIRRSRSSPMSSSSAASSSPSRRSPAGLELARQLPLLALEHALRGAARSIARCFAVAISQAPGLSGTPDRGHCSSAATSASCASSSASPTSRTIRARPAISLRRLDPPDRVDRALASAAHAGIGLDLPLRQRAAAAAAGPPPPARRAGKSDISYTWRTSITSPSRAGAAPGPLDRLLLRAAPGSASSRRRPPSPRRTARR